MMLLLGFTLGQAIGGVLAIVGFGIAVVTGRLDRTVLDRPEAIVRIFADPLVLLPSAVGSSLGLAAVAIGTPLVLRVSVKNAIAWRRPPPLAWVLGPFGAIGLGAVADQAVFYFARAFPSWTLGTLAAFGEAAHVRHPLWAVAVFVGMAIVPGTCEEVFFRGAVQGALGSRWSAPFAIGTTALAFGLVHVDPPQAIGAAILGAYLGFVAHRTRSIGPCIATHVVNNAVAFLSANVGDVADFGYGTSHPVPWSIVAGGALVAGAAIGGIWAVPRRRIPV
jgi:membrane protease YdiL (CAAX protease family)